MPLPPDMIAGLGAMAAPAPAAAAPPPIAPPPGLLDLYVKAKAAGLDDTNAALAVAQHLRSQADLRAGFRRGGDLAAGRPTDDTYRQNLMTEADRPLQELAARRATAPLAEDEAKRVGGLASADIGAQQATALRDPGHPTNVAMRASLAKIGLPAPESLTVATMPKELWDMTKPLADVQTKGQELAALAPGRAAEAKKTGAEASRVAALTGPEAAKTTAEAGKIGAETAVERQKLGIPAPGYEATGQVPRDPKIDQELQNRDASQKTIQQNVDNVLGIIGNRDFVADPSKRAQLAAPLGKLMLKLKDEAASRGLPDTELTLFGDILGDPRKIGFANVLQLSKIKERLQSFKATASQDHNAWVASHGYRQTGAPTGAPTAPGGRVNLIDPAGKKINLPAGQVDAYLTANPGAKRG